MRFLPNSEEILQAIQEIQPSRLAVAYIGQGFEKFIDPGWIDQIVLSPTPGSNPRAIRHLVDRVGWDRVHFIPELHTKIYLAGQSAIVGSANLSQRGLDVGGSWEAGMFVDDPDAISHISHTLEMMLDRAYTAYPTSETKEAALDALFQVWVPGTFPRRKRPIPDDPGDATLPEILATVGTIRDYHPANFYIPLAGSDLGITTWRYLNAFQTIDLLTNAVDSGRPAVAGIDQQYHRLFQVFWANDGVNIAGLKNMIGEMVKQILEQFEFEHDQHDVLVNGVFFVNGSTYR